MPAKVSGGIRIIETLRLEKTFKDIESNSPPTTNVPHVLQYYIYPSFKLLQGQ